MMTQTCLWLVLVAACCSSSYGAEPIDKKSKPVKLIGEACKASWSPDGQRLVFGVPGGKGLAIYDLRTGKSEPLMSDGKDAAWSPDGKEIIYILEKQFNDYVSEEVWSCPAEGGRTRRITKGGFPEWSTDGKAIHVHTRTTHKLQAVSIDNPEADPKVLLEPCNSWYPTVSPDGKSVAMSRGPALNVIDLQTRKVLLECPVPGSRGLLPAWSPDGALVAFGGFDYEASGLWVVDVKRRVQTLLIEGPYTCPSWSRDGSKVAFDRRAREGWEVWVAGSEWIESQIKEKGKPIPAVEAAPDAR